MEDYSNIDSLIFRYISGELDKESFAELKEWSLASESHRKYVRDKLEIWFSSGVANSAVKFDEKKAYLLFKQRIDHFDNKVKSHYNIPWRLFMRVVAVVFIFLIPFVAYWKGKQDMRANFSDVVVEAPVGAQTKLYLPDGTLVWLNAGSKLLYSQGFGVDDRLLHLEGEGYFEVAKNEDLPFEILTNDLNLKVLGTKFNFVNYPDDKEVTVTLIEGKVALHNCIKEMPDLYLMPDERIVLNKSTGQVVKSLVHGHHANVWINDELYFDEELLENIAKKLIRNYNVKVEVADSLRNKRFYGSFRISGHTIDEILEVMASTKQMNYKYEDGVYILY